MPSPDDLNLARRVVAQGMCQRSEVEECLSAQHQMEQNGRQQRLEELLVERGFLTRSQLARLAQSGGSSGAPAPAASRLGPYELLLKLGEGGMGAVYKASDTRNGKVVAIKVLPRSKAKDEKFLMRFEMEARAMFELDHPNIVHAYDIGNSDGYHYLVIEFVQGYDICALLEQRGRFAEAEALNILEQMAKALDHIHNEHLVHRDIKPENILVGEGGIAKLTDMGLTTDDPAHGRRRRLTEAGIAMGTPFYLSPEQIKGESEVDIRSDIYALGATTYEMITGRPPFEGDTPAVVMMKHLNEYVPSPHDLDRTISLNFCHLLERMMAKDPFHRYQTPYELLQDIRRVIKGKQPLGIRPPAGRSSIARPELHQDSQRVDPITTPAPEPVRAQASAAAKPPQAQSGSRHAVPPQAQSGRHAAAQPAAKNPGSAHSIASVPRPSDTRGPGDLRPPSPSKSKQFETGIRTAVPDVSGAAARPAAARKAASKGGDVKFWLGLTIATLVAAIAAALIYIFFFSDRHRLNNSGWKANPQPTLSARE